MTVAVFVGFQTLLTIILGNSTILKDFREILVKIYKILEKFMDFQSCSLTIFYRITNVVHWGCVNIFWNSLILA